MYSNGYLVLVKGLILAFYAPKWYFSRRFYHSLWKRGESSYKGPCNEDFCLTYLTNSIMIQTIQEIKGNFINMIKLQESCANLGESYAYQYRITGSYVSKFFLINPKIFVLMNRNIKTILNHAARRSRSG